MGPAHRPSGWRFGILPLVATLTIATGCASAHRTGAAGGYDCLVVENETADPIGVYLDVGTHVIDLGRVAAASRRALPLWRTDVPERFTHAYLRIVPAPSTAVWPPQPGPLSELIRTADTGRTLWRYNGRELIPNRGAGTSEQSGEAPVESLCAATPSGS